MSVTINWEFNQHPNLPNHQRRMEALSLSRKHEMIKSSNAEKRRKRHNGTLPLAFIGCGKNVVAQNPFHFTMWLKYRRGIFHPRKTWVQHSWNLWLFSTRWHYISNCHPEREQIAVEVPCRVVTCEWIFILHFVLLQSPSLFLRIVLSLLFINKPASHHHGRSQDETEKSFTPTKSEKEHLFAQLIRDCCW